VPAGSVVFAKRGGAIALNRIRILSEPSFMDTNVMALTPSRRLNSEFLYYVLSFRGLWDIADVTSVPQINNKHIIPFKLSLPSMDEQTRIVGVLAGADDLILTLEELIAKKQAIRHGMMQQLLTGKTRLPGFTGAWSRETLGGLGTFLKGRGIRRDDVRSLGVACIRYGELYTTYRDYTSTTVSHVSRRVAASALPIRHGDLLFAGSGETREEIGMCVAFIGRQRAVAGGDIIVLRAPQLNPVYLASLTNTPNVATQKARLGQGDAVVHISSRALASIKIDLPPRAEQDTIAAVLVDIDNTIRLLEDCLVKAKSVRQGMMQELLTGHTRLPVLEAAA
jgi:type I restriction enzyme S subunit